MMQLQTQKQTPALLQVMADQEETFGAINSPSGSDSRDLQSENKTEKQNGASTKSPSSQTTYIQQVSVCVRVAALCHT